MAGTLEREIKLRFDSAAAARDAVVAAGGVRIHERRLLEDAILDTTDASLGSSSCALRIRVEPGRCFLTYKGPPQPSPVKLREELETEVGDAALAFALFERLGFRIWFRSEKYREEFALGDAVIAIDETPVGAFVEIEGTDEGIARAAAILGRRREDYVAESYRSIFVQHCLARGTSPGDMLFPR